MVLQRILIFTVTRGILVSLVQVAHIIMYVMDPRNLLFWSVIPFLSYLSTLIPLGM
jgi:hypothetical protein